MTTLQSDDKCVQTDPCIRLSRSKFLKTLKLYLSIVSQHRLHLFNQYTQSDESYDDQDLLNVRRQILDRFAWVMIELEQTIENLRRQQLTVMNAQQSIDRPLVKEVIEVSINANISSMNNLKQLVLATDEAQMHRRHLQETKEDLYILDLFIHRGISKIDQFVESTNMHI
ncbi:unnamed protein product [Rotaria socialis]|uniref:Uncharacterized protein n=1 Tax=Rotaria socialis TaxID=392032 RepID=A0A818HRC7_9BILA|nr:unnamed protein product [Rotaria socialis]CAF3357025.1 unnamed protein product [Rotaria socialis]CAF3370340.1 unnamed protein product [Rotaria socialis]CAF3427050.1 unnamed protein product [Rotaria socialis]CAF3510639.1 unnamed protein product [Rotaria socialis]